MVAWVLDTSVVVKWFLQEPGTEAAEWYLERILSEEAKAIVPSSLFYELANVLWVRRRDGLTEEAGRKVWNELERVPLDIANWRELFPDAITVAFRHEISVYDAVFVSLAEHRSCDLVTADEKLIEKLRQTCTWVKEP